MARALTISKCVYSEGGKTRRLPGSRIPKAEETNSLPVFAV
jgi:hypothetical protein